MLFERENLIALLEGSILIQRGLKTIMQQRKNSSVFIDFFWGRYFVLSYSMILFGFSVFGLIYSIWFFIPTTILGVLSFIGWKDFFQKKHGVLANYPILGRFRYLLESVRPELRQYFWEDDTDELPYSRNQRAMVYQRAKDEMAARPLVPLIKCTRKILVG